jgi:hypothetical protein
MDMPRLAEAVVLPTPPLPDVTTITRFSVASAPTSSASAARMGGRRWRAGCAAAGGAAGTAGRRCAAAACAGCAPGAVRTAAWALGQMHVREQAACERPSRAPERATAACRPTTKRGDQCRLPVSPRPPSQAPNNRPQNGIRDAPVAGRPACVPAAGGSECAHRVQGHAAPCRCLVPARRGSRPAVQQCSRPASCTYLHAGMRLQCPRALHGRLCPCVLRAAASESGN